MSKLVPYILIAVFALAAPASGAGLTTGFLDGAFASGSNGAVFDEAAAAGSGMLRIPLSWGSVARVRPANAADPADPAYDWSGPDGAVAAAHVRGLQVLLSLDGVPEWAEQGKRPRRYRAGTYRPSPAALRDFAVAVGRRYAGSVRYVQLLNEPNLDLYLSPQWSGGKMFAPIRYRALLNAAYPGLHAAGMKLVTAGTAPYGDPGRGGSRIRPRLFWRAVMRKRVRFDVLAHHPYAVDGPRRRAYSKNDIAVPDVHRLVSLTRSAVRRGRVLPRKAKGYWVTEIGWDSKPPDPNGYAMRRFSRWVGDSMFVLWKQGVDHVFWFLVRDQAPTPSYAATRQSGMFFASGKAKLALRAFRFPFSCERRGSGTRVWLRAPDISRVRIETTSGTPLRTVRPGSDRVALVTVPGRPAVRAVSGSMRSISCRA